MRQNNHPWKKDQTTHPDKKRQKKQKKIDLQLKLQRSLKYTYCVTYSELQGNENDNIQLQKVQ